jgi:hypothetical protein
MGPVYLKIRKFCPTFLHKLISFLVTTFSPFTWITEIFWSLKFPAQNLERPIIQMHTHMILFTLITFSSVDVSDFLDEVVNVAKCIVDILQGLPNSCVFILNSEWDVKGEKNFVWFPTSNMYFLKDMCSDFESPIGKTLFVNTFLKRKNINMSSEYK